MQSLRDKNKDKNLRTKIAVGILVFVLLVILAPVAFPKLGNGLRGVFRPIFLVEDNIGANTRNFFANFKSKRALEGENESLQKQIAGMQTELLDRDTLANENEALKEILGRKASDTMVLATVLVKPCRSLYDTLIL